MSEPSISVVLKDVVQEYPAPQGEGVIRIGDGGNLTLDRPGIYLLR